ncbi:GTP-binding protein [Gordonia sp. TBRC 11910]|uniref:GTP-binding protein n=1 Tax=Gordonia asplenii TaxID=2725283 RepID=A0A848L2C0_9ACTN|nr:GTP-binding protein [Gordonia asplenii]NMO01798.1 GTP-binding protein [Gordonia asplenii]
MTGRPRQVPIILVAGFLGSGKSTLLNHLLRHSGATRIGLIINDFGAINVDALLVAGQVDGVVGLGNGCMCCTVDDDSPEGFAAVVGRLLAPRAGIDAIVIEASGLAEPRTLIRMVAALTDARAVYGGLVYLVDGAEFLATRARHSELDGHVRIADLVIVNKADLLDGAESSSAATDSAVADRAAVLGAVAELNPTAPVVLTVESVVDPALLFDPVQGRADVDGPRQLSLDDLLRAEERAGSELGDCSGHRHRHLHDEYQSVSFESSAPMNPRRLAAFLERPPNGTYRIKGWAHFGLLDHREKYIFHAVGGRIRVDAAAWAGEPPSTSIVVIGAGLVEQEVVDGLRAAVGTHVDDEFGILSITRYSPQTQGSPSL